VVAPLWAIRRWVQLSSRELAGTAHVRLEPDGSVTPVVPVKVGDRIVGWELA
jgi:hypothetical protein